MSPTQYKKVIQNELRALNQTIDTKIMRGQSYKHEARKHKALLHKMKSLASPGRYSFAKIIGSFLF